MSEKNAKCLFDLYGKRWGIETSYRVKDNFRAKTTSKSYVVRLFYFSFSICLYNLWILLNIFISVIIGKPIKKPLITAKIFGTVLYEEELFLVDATQLKEKFHKKFPEYKKTYTELDTE